jgi:hypothetical protein
MVQVQPIDWVLHQDVVLHINRSIAFLFTIILAVFVSGCAVKPATLALDNVVALPDVNTPACTENNMCKLQGVLSLMPNGPYSSAVITDAQKNCWSILVDPQAYKQKKNLNDKMVVAYGQALRRHTGPVGTLTIEYRGRAVVEGICKQSTLLIYVDEIIPL